MNEEQGSFILVKIPISTMTRLRELNRDTGSPEELVADYLDQVVRTVKLGQEQRAADEKREKISEYRDALIARMIGLFLAFLFFGSILAFIEPKTGLLMVGISIVVLFSILPVTSHMARKKFDRLSPGDLTFRS